MTVTLRGDRVLDQRSRKFGRTRQLSRKLGGLHRLHRLKDPATIVAFVVEAFAEKY